MIHLVVEIAETGLDDNSTNNKVFSKMWLLDLSSHTNFKKPFSRDKFPAL
jgi:hypothetical protein